MNNVYDQWDGSKLLDCLIMLYKTLPNSVLPELPLLPLLPLLPALPTLPELPAPPLPPCTKKGSRATSSVTREPVKSKRRRPPTLPHCGAVPSAQPGLTSLFGMGRGGTPAQWPPGYALPHMLANGLHVHGRGRISRTRLPAKPRARRAFSAPATGVENPRAGSSRAISSARLWRRRLCTCALSTS